MTSKIAPPSINHRGFVPLSLLGEGFRQPHALSEAKVLLSQDGSVGELLGHAHCVTWRWMVWLTTKMLVLVNTSGNLTSGNLPAVWVAPMTPQGEDAAIAIGPEGHFAILWRQKDQTWEQAANREAVVVGNLNEALFLDPEVLWEQGFYFGPKFGGIPGCDLGSAVLWKVRQGQDLKHQLEELQLRGPRRPVESGPGECTALVLEPGVLSMHPVWGNVMLRLDEKGRHIVSSPFSDGRGDAWPLKLHSFSWTRLGGFVQESSGWYAKLDLETKFSASSYKFYRLNTDPTASYVGGMEDWRGDMWFLCGPRLIRQQPR